MKREDSDQYFGIEETEQRTRAIIRAAAKALPIPLKAIPKKYGGKRKLRGAKKSGA
ncbi:MAG TPA: hypothetical protein VMF58_01455 [Rhizomicrobium sp.]|nr:hypothetical protein [Rhizomicrobium sp.]